MNTKPVRLQGWRRLASALWSAPNDPQIYGSLAIDASGLLAFIERARSAGRHLTPTHLVGRAVARALTAVPALNVRLVGDHAIPRDGVDLFFIAAIGAAGVQDLSGVKVKRVDEKDVFGVGRELDERRSLGKSKRSGEGRGSTRQRKVQRTKWCVRSRNHLGATLAASERFITFLPCRVQRPIVASPAWGSPSSRDGSRSTIGRSSAAMAFMT